VHDTSFYLYWHLKVNDLTWSVTMLYKNGELSPHSAAFWMTVLTDINTILCNWIQHLIDWLINKGVRALTVPMHLGLIDGHFVPHNLISAQDSPVPLLNFQMGPRLKNFMASGSKRGTQIYFSCVSNVPANEPPTGPQWRERPVYRAFCIALKNLIFRVAQ